MRSVVITSKVAQKDFLNIKNRHADLVQSFAMQKQKFDMLNQQKAVAAQAEQTLNAEMEKEKMTANTEAQKTSLDFSLRQGELDIKRAELSSNASNV